MNENQVEFKEGKLYKYQDGELSEIKTEPNQLPKIRVLNQADEAIESVRGELLETFKGYRLDKVLVASALILIASQQKNIAFNIKDFVKDFFDKQL